jgi:hypothetical protein
MWEEWPGKLKAGLKGDKGMDIVAETRDKQLVVRRVGPSLRVNRAVRIDRGQPALLDLLQLRQHLFGKADHRLLIVWGREAGDQVAVANL